MRVLVCGGRDYRYARRIFFELDSVRITFGLTVLIHGAAPGADRIAGQWAAKHGIPVEDFPADWFPHGKDGGRDNSAGPKRNARMLAEGRPDLVVAFPGASGTNDMIQRARAAGIRVQEILR